MAGAKILDLYVPRKSFFHNLDPRTKLALFLTVTFISILFMDFFLQLLVLMTILISFLFFCKIPLLKIRRLFSYIAIPTLVVFFGFPLVERGGNVLLYFDWPWYHWMWITDRGVILGSITFMRILSWTLATFLVVMTTNREGILNGFEMFGISYKFSFAVTIAISFIPTILGIFSSIIEAQKARAFEWEKGSFIEKGKRFTKVMYPLMFSCLRYIVLLPLTMEARAFGAHRKRTYIDDYKLNKLDYAIIVLSIATIVLTVLLGFLGILHTIFTT